MQKIIYISILLILGCLNLAGQIRISGFVKDSITNEVLVGAHVYNENTRKGTATDNNGFFSLIVNNNSKVQITYVGYSQKEFVVNEQQSSPIIISLSSTNTLNEVIVTARKRQRQHIVSLSSKEIQQIPTLGAKPDVIKAIQLLPGIQTQNEGTSTLMVRGGNPGENLYLFDNVALIYVNHLGGFTSVFNPDIINNIDVYKGGFPAKYGGKLSSIVDIAQREGNRDKLKGAFSIGITDASFLIEGPTPLKNSSFILTGRKTLTYPIFALGTSLSNSNDFILSYGFHDINGKFTWKPNSRNSLSLNLYQGDDYLNWWYVNKTNSGTERARFQNIWGNWLLSTRWNRVHNASLFSSQSISFVRYRLKRNQTYRDSDPEEGFDFSQNFLSNVNDFSYKWDFKLDIIKNWKLDFGLNSSYLRSNPNLMFATNIPNYINEAPINSFENAIYTENKFEILSVFQLRLGARFVNYISSNFSETTIEPRANLDIQLNNNHALNINYQDLNQNFHLLFTPGEIMNNEVWVPANAQIKPANSKQISVGWIGNFHQGMFQAELSTYYKSLTNIACYTEGYKSLMGDGNWREKVESGGEGEAYGVEFFLKKNEGVWTGFLSYTWSRSYRQFANINEGMRYVYEYDRPHNLSININRKLNDKFSFSASWVLQSGIPFTPVIGKRYILSYNNVTGEVYYYEAFIYGEKNSERMSIYHRLDLALHYTKRTKKGHKAQWTFAIYNAYNNKNPYTYIYTHDTSLGAIVPMPFMRNANPFSLYQVSFFPIIPTVSYKIFFDDIKKAFNQRAKRKVKKNKEKVKKKGSWLYFEE